MINNFSKYFIFKQNEKFVSFCGCRH
jgi:hypothetical protein